MLAKFTPGPLRRRAWPVAVGAVVAGGGSFGGHAHADEQAYVELGPSAQIALTVELEVGLLGTTDSDTDSTNVAVVGGALLRPLPVDEPYTSCRIADLALETAPASLSFDFLCLPFIGCQTLQVSISDLEITQRTDVDATVTKGSILTAVPVVVTGTLSTSGIGDPSSQKIASEVDAELDARLSRDGSDLVLDQVRFDQLVVTVPPESLPSGIDSITATITADLGAFVLRGPLVPVPPAADLDGDGSVGGADLSILLSAWGSAGPGDLDGDGVVGGSDLTALLAAWG